MCQYYVAAAVAENWKELYTASSKVVRPPQDPSACQCVIVSRTSPRLLFISNPLTELLFDAIPFRQLLGFRRRRPSLETSLYNPEWYKSE